MWLLAWASNAFNLLHCSPAFKIRTTLRAEISNLAAMASIELPRFSLANWRAASAFSTVIFGCLERFVDFELSGSGSSSGAGAATAVEGGGSGGEGGTGTIIGPCLFVPTWINSILSLRSYGYSPRTTLATSSADPPMR